MELSNKLSCTDLKLELEAKIVEALLETRNAVRLLIFADSHTCALLYERSIELIYKQGDAISSLPDWTEIEKSAELASKVALCSISKPLMMQNEGSCFEHLDISGQRRQLDAMGEDVHVDSTRETLVRRFKRAKHGGEDDTNASANLDVQA